MSLVNDVIGQLSRDALSVKNDWPVFVDGAETIVSRLTTQSAIRI